MYELNGKVAIVTGSGRRNGSGEAVARRLAAEGAMVMLHDLGESKGAISPEHGIGKLEELQAITDEIISSGGQAEYFAADMLIPSEVKSLIGRTIDTFGPIDIVINNAGVGYLFGPLIELDVAHWDAVLSVNLRGPFLTLKYAAPHMIKQGDGGRIVNIASVAAKRGSAHVGAYSSSKHGLIGLTRIAAQELAPHGITVNAVCPNHVTTGLGSWQNDYMANRQNKSVEEYLTDMRKRIPLGRVGLTSDTANACAFLCSDQASYITAEAMNVSGGEEYH